MTDEPRPPIPPAEVPRDGEQATLHRRSPGPGSSSDTSGSRCLAGLRASLEEPHPSVSALEPLGFGDWAALAQGHHDLIEPDSGTPVRWRFGAGWLEGME